MSDDRDESHPASDALKGLGLLFRAGRKTARRVKAGIDKSNVGRSIDDAGKEVVRAIDSVVGRLAGEPKKPAPREGDAPAGKRDDSEPKR